jgi:3-oxoacyl-[acyl-carrier protein] reductase
MVDSTAPAPVTLVTGVSRGIGRAIAERLGAAGHVVVGLSRTKPDFPLSGGFYPVDLADEAATATALAAITAAYSIDNLVNNAGLITVARLEALSFADFDRIIGINVRAAMQCVQACLPAMRARGRGRIVNIGSRAMYGKVGRTAYGASKAAIVGATRGWALEVARAGITVNCVVPGPIETELFRASNLTDDPVTLALIESVPVGRMGEPREIAATVAFLLSDDAGFITGQAINVCGGLTIGLDPL